MGMVTYLVQVTNMDQGRIPMKLLHIDSSILGEASASRELSAAIVTALSRTMPNLEIVRRDLDADPIPHLDSRLLAAVRPEIAAGPATHTDDKGAAALEEFWARTSSSSARRCTISRSRASSRRGSTESSSPARPFATTRPAPKDLPEARR